MKCVYGPLHSYRLGISQGVDIIPPSTCTYDCIYCQLGKTRNKVKHWRGLNFPDIDDIIEELERRFKINSNVDFITISGSGEPTLNPQMGDIANRIRTISNIPMVLITNSSLLTYDTVLESARKFDVVMPSLDAGDDRTFKMINRPAKGLDVDEISGAIKRLAQESMGDIWLEVMLLKGKITNTSTKSIINITKKINEINPNMVFLNTPSRPTQEKYIIPLTNGELERIRLTMMSEITEDIDIQVVNKLTFDKTQLLAKDDLSKEIPRLLAIRPCTLKEISNLIGSTLSETSKFIGHMMDTGTIIKIISNNKTYYQSQSDGTD